MYFLCAFTAVSCGVIVFNCPISEFSNDFSPFFEIYFNMTNVTAEAEAWRLTPCTFPAIRLNLTRIVYPALVERQV
jgi:hypothetical protein